MRGLMNFFFCHFWILHKISFSYMCMMYILWLICGWEKQKSKNKLWLITLEFDKIWKIWIHYKKDHLIRLLSVEKKFQKVHSSAPHRVPKTFDFQFSKKQNYVNLRRWNPNLRAMGLIWSALSDFTAEKNFRTTLLILGFSSKRHQSALYRYVISSDQTQVLIGPCCHESYM